MGKRNLPSAPEISYGETDGLPSKVRIWAPKLSRWAVDMQRRLEALLGEVDDNKVTPNLPIELPTLLNSEIAAGTRYRAGAKGALVYVPDAPGGGCPAYRNGTAWVLMTPGTSGIADAPSNGNQYVRLNAAWAVLPVTPVPLIAYIDADLPAVTSTVITDTTGLFVPLEANVAYSVTVMLRYLVAATTTGLKVTMTWPASSFAAFQVTIPALAAGIGSDYSERLGTSGTTVTAPSTPTAGTTSHVATIAGMIRVTTAGNLQVRHAGDDTGSLTIRRGSHMILTPVG